MNLTLETAVEDDTIAGAGSPAGLLTVAELKLHERVSYSTEDAYIEECILDAYRFFDGRDGWLNRAILTQTWTLKLPGFLDIMELPLPPLQSVSAVKYLDTDNVLQTLASSVYTVVTGDLFGRVERAYGQSWPDTYDHPEAVQITFVAGYGDPDAVKQNARGVVRGIRLLAGHLFRNREETYVEPRVVEVSRRIQFGLEKLAGLYRIPNRHA